MWWRSTRTKTSVDRMDVSCQNQTKILAIDTDLYQLKTFLTRKKEVQVFVMVKEVFVML